MSQKQEFEGAISGLIAGAVSGAVVSKLIQQKTITQPSQKAVSITKQILYKSFISESAQLISLEAELIIVLIHGDGDNSVTLTITIDDNTTEIYGDDQAVGLASRLEITASGTGYTPTIEVAYFQIT